MSSNGSACGESAEDRVAATLRGIWASGLPTGERRRLCRSAVAAAVCSSTSPTTSAPGLDIPAGDVQEVYEQCLSTVGRAAGMQTRPNITRAKEFLRDHPTATEGSGRAFASKLSRLSCIRNTAVHEASGKTLLRELEEYLGQDKGVFQHTKEAEQVASALGG